MDVERGRATDEAEGAGCGVLLARASSPSGAILGTTWKENTMERIVLYHNPG